MNIKKLIVSQIKKVAVKEATNKILPMDGDVPKLGKGKLAAILAVVAAIAAAIPEFIK